MTIRGLSEFRGLFPTVNGSGQTVVVIDTGFTSSTGTLGNNSRLKYQGNFSSSTNTQDPRGHGTAVTSVIASEDLRAPGIAPGANVITLKVFNDIGQGSTRAIERALQWTVDNAATYGITAINMSLSDGTNSNTHRANSWSDELAKLKDKGILPIASAGNYFAEYSKNIGSGSPAADINSVGVGATTGGSMASYSQRHPFLAQLVAEVPQAAIDNRNNFSRWQGTSFSSPVVTGISLLAQDLATDELGRRLSVDEFNYLAQKTATPLVDSVTGYSFSQIDAAALGRGIQSYSGSLGGSSIFHAWGGATQIQEANTGSSPVSFYVGRVGDLTKSESVNYSFTGNAIVGQDITPVLTSRSANFLPGQSVVEIKVNVLADNSLESTELATFQLAPGSGDIALNPKASISILNTGGTVTPPPVTPPPVTPPPVTPPPNTGELPNFSVAALTGPVTEGFDSLTGFRLSRDRGTAAVNFTFDLYGDPRLGSDYLIAPGQQYTLRSSSSSIGVNTITIPFAAGEMSKNFNISLVNDSAFESREDLKIVTQSTSSFRVTYNRAAIVILDNDVKPSSYGLQTLGMPVLDIQTPGVLL